ncbi:MAG: FeoB-associated Cys-rich membrane protein [Bacteroidota bacterium]
MMQSLIVILLFAGACFYLGRMGYQAFFSKKGKCDGCAVAKLYEMKQENISS